MKSLAAQSLIDTINTAVLDIDRITAVSPITESYLAKFLTVFISGIYEEIIETLVKEMCISSGGSAPLYNFVDNYLHRSFRNPDTSNLIDLLKRFEPIWGATIQALPPQAKDALDSILRDKNNIAHGSPSTITLNDIKSYYNSSMVVIEKVDDMLLP